MWTEEDRLEHYCRMGLLAVAVLHWILFALMVSASDPPISNRTRRAFSTFAAILPERLAG